MQNKKCKPKSQTMNLNTNVRYAVTALVDMTILIDQSHDHAEAGKKTSVSLSSIAQRQGISQAYLEQIFAKLKKRQLVQSYRGPGGGYLLAKEPQHISIAEIIEAVNGKIDMRKCKGGNNCKGGEMCLTHNLWLKLNLNMHNFLNELSLQSLIENGEPSVIFSTS